MVKSLERAAGGTSPATSYRSSNNFLSSFAPLICHGAQNTPTDGVIRGFMVHFSPNHVFLVVADTILLTDLCRRHAWNS